MLLSTPTLWMVWAVLLMQSVFATPTYPTANSTSVDNSTSSDNSSLASIEAWYNPQGKIASVYFSLGNVDRIRNYYIMESGAVMEIAFDEGSGWTGPVEILPGIRADVGWGLAADTFEANGNFYINVYYTSNNLARCLIWVSEPGWSGWYEDSNAFDAANFDFTPLVAGHVTVNGVTYARVYGTQASQNCQTFSCTVLELIWDSVGQKWGWGAFPFGFPKARSGNYMAYEGRPNVFEGHLFYYGGNPDGSWGLVHAYYTNGPATIPGVPFTDWSALGSITSIGWPTVTNQHFNIVLYIGTSTQSIFEVVWPADNSAWPTSYTNQLTENVYEWSDGVSSVPLVTAIGWMGIGFVARDTAYIRLMDWRCVGLCTGIIGQYGMYVTSLQAGGAWSPANTIEAIWLGHN